MSVSWPELFDKQPEAADDVIRPFGLELRKLIRDLATPLADRCGVGLSFRVDHDAERLIFAEVRDAQQERQFLDEGGIFEGQYRHRLRATDAFVRLIEEAAEKKNRCPLGNLDISQCDEVMVVRPLLALFGDLSFNDVLDVKKVETPWDSVPKALQNVFVEAFALGTMQSGGCTLYVVFNDDDLDNESSFEEHLGAFRFVLPLVANLVREAIFFAAVITNGDIDDQTYGTTIEELQRVLDALLPDEMPAFGSRQRAFLRGMLHPVFGSTLDNLTPPELKDFEDFPHEASAPFLAIQTASTIKYERPLSGSLRGAGAPALVEIIPRHIGAGGGSPLPYRAVVKSASRSEVLREQRGLTRLWGYYNEIGHFLPQNPLHFPYSSSEGTVRFVTMTPHVGDTVSLHEKAKTSWSEDGRHQYFRDVFTKLSAFIMSIGKSEKKRLSPAVPLQEAFGGANGRPLRRRQKLLKTVQWPECIPPDVSWLNVVGSRHAKDLKIVNPRWVIERLEENPNWAVDCFPQELPVEERVYAHGDLHCGNILVEAGEDLALTRKVVVLDFDYVGTSKSEHADTTTLECSFLMSVFQGLGGMNDDSIWNDRIVPAVLVRWRPPIYRDLLENNRFVHDINYVLDRLPFSGSTCLTRSACRAVAMLRLLASHYLGERKNLANASGSLWAAWLMAGLCLSELFPPTKLGGASDVLDLKTAFATVWPG